METAPRAKLQLWWMVLETKYRDIADGNRLEVVHRCTTPKTVGNQVPRYSGWKQNLEVRNGQERVKRWKPSTAI